jgi:hypothetical protein
LNSSKVEVVALQQTMVVVTATDAVRGLPKGYQEGMGNDAGLTMVLFYFCLRLTVGDSGSSLFTENYGITLLWCCVLCSLQG